MRFRILGALEVWNAGDRIRIAGVTRSKALAVLLAEANHTVPLHRMVTALWDEDPPATSRRQVQNAVASMRREMAANGGDPIERVGDGYRLVTDDLDWLDFKHDVARAQTCAAAGRPSEAEQLLLRALDLWEGPALAGLSGKLIESAARRMDEARLSANEDLIDAELALGRFGSAIERARDLLANHPSRQKTAGQLMLALHLAGRNEESLQIYSDLRARLADELGLAPDGSLQRLHGQILRGEAPNPAVTAEPPPPRPDLPTPAQLPADISGFVGREGELAELDMLLKQDRAAAAIPTGVGGGGKMALAVHWGHRHRDDFPDGQLYVNLRGYDTAEPLAPIEALGSMLRSLGYPGESIPTDLDEAAALYRSLLADREVLVVLDNARTVAQVSPLLPGGRGTVTIVTSRERLRGLTAMHGARSITLNPLGARDAVELLASVVGEERLRADPEAAQRIGELCAGHPLALRVAGANLASRSHDSVSEFAAQLAEDNDRLKLLSVDGDPNVAVTATFDRSFAALDRGPQSLLCRLGVLPGEDFTAEMAMAIGSGPEADDERSLSALVDGHLLANHRPGRYRFHDLVRLYARQRQQELLTDTERERTIERFIDWHRRTRLVDEFDNVVDACRQWSDHPRVWQLTVALRPQLNTGYGLVLLRELAERALSVAESNGDMPGVAHMHTFLSGIASVMGDLRTGVRHGEIAIGLIRDHGCGDEDGMIRASHGSLLSNLGRPADAEPLMREALSAAEDLGDTRAVIVRSGNLGAIRRKLGKYDQAERCLVRAAEMAEQRGRDFGSYAVLARVFLDTGRFAETDRILAVAMRKATDSPRKKILALLARGDLRRRTGDAARARADLTEALDLARQYHLRSDELEARCHLASLRGDEGDTARALRDIRALLSELDGTRDFRVLGETLLAAADISLDAGLPMAAVEYAERARQNFGARHIPLRHGQSLMALARAHAALGAPETARAHAQRALDIFTDIGVPRLGRRCGPRRIGHRPRLKPPRCAEIDRTHGATCRAHDARMPPGPRRARPVRA
ncbi:AfsR/SARP family transcriptional regulator [Glycomyces salinus]|uniref:AfsR/SARP family transcriptional regulator n=1 Tax=Glycomyces salinus TaxID=980294 RepID=UPI0018EE3809|nr:BTAD domain-containing putative transcriptional regulator [Glycomyces salinus]